MKTWGSSCGLTLKEDAQEDMLALWSAYCRLVIKASCVTENVLVEQSRFFAKNMALSTLRTSLSTKREVKD